MADLLPWAIAGTYLEACNCEAICPCRRVGGRSGGRSTTGICEGALSWQVEQGRAGDIELAGLGAVLVLRYSDDEPGSPWTFFLYVDDRGDEHQRHALAKILTGELGGSALEHFPWAWKPSHMLGWRAVAIEIDHGPRRGWFRAGGRVTLRIGDPVADQEPVTCVIPGHDRSGKELRAEVLSVDEGPLAFEVHGKCAYQSTFAYSSDGG
ncbi:MAG TPA: DUF1326 domain-containing protein [Solirubrobacteraceae bacterium]|nr:DUF1326 domain-containing protein [Solirubrobacteraceae bacterium]